MYPRFLTIIVLLIWATALSSLSAQWAPVGSINVWSGADPIIETGDPDLILVETGSDDSQFGIIMREASTNRAWMQFSPSGGDLHIECEEDDIIFDSSDDFWFQSDNTNRMFLSGGGLLGIGTTSPQELLHLDGASGAADLRLEADLSKYIRFYEGATQKAFIGHSGTDLLIENDETGGDVTIDAESILRMNTDDITRMTISKSGLVGIGTTSPGAALHLNGVNTTLRMDGTNGTYLRFYDSGVQSGFLGIGNVGGDDITLRNFLEDGSIILDSDNDVQLQTNGTSKLSITEEGDVGIGTTSPNEKLAINGAINIGSTSNANSGTIRYTGSDFEGRTASGWRSLTDTGDPAVWSYNGDDIYFDSGDVGIGLSSQPLANLHIKDPQVAGLRLDGDIGQLVYFYEGTFQRGRLGYESNEMRLIAPGTIGLRTNGNIEFGSPDRMIIASNGRVAIGPASPQEQLDVDGGIRLANTTEDNEGTIRYTGTDFEARTPNGWTSLTDTSLWYANGADAIYEQGNVGIGTTTPTGATLHVEGDFAGDGIRVSRSGSSVISEWSSDGSEASIGTTSNHAFRLMSNNAVGLTLTQEGNVAIGTTSASTKLNVFGDIATRGLRLWTAFDTTAGMIQYDDGDFQGYNGSEWVSFTDLGPEGPWTESGADVHRAAGFVGIGTSTPTAALDVVGNVNITGELTSSSDERLKKDIKPILNALEAFSSLRPVSYSFKTRKYQDLNLPSGERMGLIAQELQQHFPELVTVGSRRIDERGEQTEFLSINYVELVPLLLASIQELKEELEHKDSTMQKLSEQISALTDSVNLLLAKADQGHVAED